MSKVKKKNTYFVKKNNRCPHCTYPCDSATSLDGQHRPYPGCISFCIMCCEPAQWDVKMKLIKFDINSTPNLILRNQIKLMGAKIIEFWDSNSNIDDNNRREKYLKIMDKI